MSTRFCDSKVVNSGFKSSFKEYGSFGLLFLQIIAFLIVLSKFCQNKNGKNTINPKLKNLLIAYELLVLIYLISRVFDEGLRFEYKYSNNNSYCVINALIFYTLPPIYYHILIYYWFFRVGKFILSF